MNRDVPLLGTELPYGQPWDGYDQVDEEREAPEAESEQEGPYIGPYETDPFFEAYDDDDEDDDDLLAALDEALDEVEAEARVEFARGLAFPELDALELIPMADTAYRSAIAVFMGARLGPRAPRYSQLVRAFTVRDRELGALLQDNLHRSRAYVERRRSQICWVS